MRWLRSCCLHLLIISLLHYQVIVCSSSFSSSNSTLSPLCPRDQSIALLDFKNLISINNFGKNFCYGYVRIASYAKTDSWKEGTDCCTWDGVMCDRITGHVIGLDLSCCFIVGNFPSISPLYRLPRLQRINLARNDFNNAPIPSELGGLTGLTHLNLSVTSFSGKIPLVISNLSKLVSLDLSYNSGSQLEKQVFESLVQNLTELRELFLDWVDMSLVELGSLSNLSSTLTSVSMENCGLQGKLPDNIFRLPNLQMLYLRDNLNLTGYFPEGNWSSSLQFLDLSFSSFSGKLPNSIGNLKALRSLNLANCFLYGPLPVSLENLTQITHLDLKYNNFSGAIPSGLSNLGQLHDLSLSQNNLSGQILFTITNLTQLDFLDLSYNQLVGSIPSGEIPPPYMTVFLLDHNQLSGAMPSWLFRVPSMVVLDLSYNKLIGHIDEFQCRTFNSIHLRNNGLEGPIPRSIFEQVNLTYLDLSSNNLSGSMDMYILPELENIRRLDLSKNNINGLIPKWLWNSGKYTLGYLNLSHNLLEGFDSPPVIFPWTQLIIFDLQSNLLHGSLPLPSLSIEFYRVANNMLSGVVPPLICNLSLLTQLDLSGNNFSGLIPPCFKNISQTLSMLNLRRNHFHGTLPQICDNGRSWLRTLDVGDNQLQGVIPRSLANCTSLEVLNLRNNSILDTFPFWLDMLPRLQVLVLRSNRFYGPISQPNKKPAFSNLNIIDLSYNNFTGDMPSKFFESLSSMAMNNDSNGKIEYLRERAVYYYYFDSVTIRSKGLDMELVKILTIFKAIDFSNNKFKGEIPKSIGNLKSLRVLNFSGNWLTGPIPSSLSNLSVLESLDLSSNSLSGGIPPQLLSLTFLSAFDVSQNHLEGPIPLGSQFVTFSNASYQGNSGLCGLPLSKKCGNGEKEPLPPVTSEPNHSSMTGMDVFDWIVVLMGYGCGLVIGVVGGNLIIQWKLEKWLMNKLKHWTAS